MPTFASLAEALLVQAKQLDEELALSNKQPTSFDVDTLKDLDAKTETVRKNVIDLAQETKRLAMGTHGTYSEILLSYTDEVALRAIYKYKLAHHVPLNGTATFAEIANRSGLREDFVERFLRHAMGSRIFTESPPGHVKHTANSRALVEDSDAYDAVGLMMFDVSPCGQRVLDALQKWNYSASPDETTWVLANELTSNIGMYEDLAEDPERARRFGAGMRYFSRGPGWDLSHLVEHFDWRGTDREGATFLDIGGGHGTVSQRLAQTTKNVQFIVQDLPGTCEAGLKALPEEYNSRISFEPHDFFKEQPRQADIYFFRWIMHNWSDEYCIRILRALIPALKPGARVINYEAVLTDGPEHDWSNRMPRQFDMIMQAQFNAPERTERAWKNLFQRADPRLRLDRIIRPEGSVMCIIEAVWDEAPADDVVA